MTKEQYYEHILKSDMQEQKGVTIHKDSFIDFKFDELYPIREEEVEFVVINNDGVHFYEKLNSLQVKYDPIASFELNDKLESRVDVIGYEIYIHIRVISDDSNFFTLNLVTPIPIPDFIKNNPFLTMSYTEFENFQIKTMQKIERFKLRKKPKKY